MDWTLQFLPLVIMIESFGAGGILVWQKQYGSGLYWIAAGILNFAVIYGIKNWG